MLHSFDAAFSDRFINRVLIDIEDRMVSMGENSLQAYGLPQVHQTSSNILPTGIIQETSYNINALEWYVSKNEPKVLKD